MDTPEASPYAPPATSAARTEETAPVEPTIAELRAVVGPKADYYLAQWRRSPAPGANWAAFFWSAFWLVHRGMYVVAAIFIGCSLLTGVLEVVVFSLLGYEDVPRAFARVTDLILQIVCAALGNRWYLRHVQKVIARTRALGLPEDEHLRTLAQRGGTRPWSAFGCVAVLVFLLLGVFVALTYLGGD